MSAPMRRLRCQQGPGGQTWVQGESQALGTALGIRVCWGSMGADARVQGPGTVSVFLSTSWSSRVLGCHEGGGVGETHVVAV